MFRNFNEIEKYILEKKIVKRIALCGAHDDAALSAVVGAKRKGVVSGTLIGNEAKIREMLVQMEEPAENYEIIDQQREKAAAKMAVQLVREGRADIPMKGSMPSATYLMPIVDPVNGLMEEGGILNSITVFYYPDRDRLMFLTDPALNIAPKLDEKVKLIKNTVKLARALGFEKVNVAALSALEKVSHEIPSSIEAGQLAEMDWGEDVVVAGPFALDNALDIETARHKGITNESAGNADVLLAPEICAGNVLHKSLHYFAHLPSASAMGGSRAPVVFTSRSDSPESKYYSILIAILQALVLTER